MNKILLIKNIFFTFSLLSLFSCNNPEDALPQAEWGEASGNYPSGIFVLNEGNFDWGHGTITHFDPQSGQVSENIFRQKNGFELGNVAQFLTLHEGKGYVVLNNSSRIEVVNPYTMQWEGRIKLPNSSPRSFLPLSSQKAYVTDLYASQFYVVNPQDQSLIKTVKTSGWNEKMLRYKEYVYMTQSRRIYERQQEGGDLLLKIDAQTDQIVDSLEMPAAAVNLQIDALNKLWVLCNGRQNQEAPALVKVNPEKFAIQKTFRFDNPSATQPGSLQINASGTVLYYLNGGVFRHPIEAEKLETKPFIKGPDHLFYSLGYDPVENLLYVADAVDYVQKGWVFRFDREGVKIDSFQAGVIPTQFVFY